MTYPISYRQLEEMMKERGVGVDHSSLNRWVLKYTPQLENVWWQSYPFRLKLNDRTLCPH